MFFGEGEGGVLRTPPTNINTQRTRGNDTFWGANEAETTSRRSYGSEDYQSWIGQPKRQFMSSLQTLYGNQDEIARKRRLQAELADSLRQQIEEKKRMRQTEPPRKYGAKSVNQQAESMLQEMKASHQPGPASLPPASIMDFDLEPQVQRVTMAPKFTLQAKEFKRSEPSVMASTLPVRAVHFGDAFASSPPPVVHVSTESPFSHTNVATPPLGFSIRKAQPVKSSMAIGPSTINRSIPQTKFSRSAMTHIPQTFGRANDTEVEEEVVAYAKPPGGQKDWTLKRLDTASELVYPDGHSSSVSSPR